MNKIAPPDAIQREKILYLLDKNLLVEAGAGSGKTSSLVGRMLAQVVAGNFRVREMAAVTFTRKAAAELRARFQNKLEEEYRNTSDTLLRARLEQALGELDQSFLGTIHSFCARLLKERPIEAGLDPQFKELDEVQNRLLQERAWDSYLEQVKRTKPDLFTQLDNLGISPLELKSSFIRLSGYSDVPKVYQQVPKPDLQQALAQILALVNRVKPVLPEMEPTKGYDPLQGAIVRSLRQLRYLDLHKDVNVIQILANFDKEPKVTLNRWNSSAAAKGFREEFATLRETVVAPVLARWREYCHFYLMDFVLPAVEHFEQMRFSLSLLNYDDLLSKAAQMLANYPEVRQYFQEKYRCLLIDEFQDTDPIQAQLMFYLTGQDVTEHDWQKLVPKPGSLFVVGDPKQSIYRFRRADMDIYNLVKQLMVTHGGEVVKLTANFRSLQALGDWFNPVFTGLLPSVGTTYQAEFSDLHTMLPNQEGTVTGVQVLDIPVCDDRKENSKQKLVERDAEQIARYIRWALDGNLRLAGTPEEGAQGITRQPRPKDFLIITRYKDLMHSYARALENYGIQVAMAGGSSLKEVHEIQELHKLLRFLVDPHNQILLLALLRGVFFGLSDDQLYQFKISGGRFSLFAPLPEGLEPELAETISWRLEKLRTYYQWSHSFSSVVALEKIVEDLGLIPYVLGVGAGLSRCAYVYQVLEVLRTAEANGAIGFNVMVERFGVFLQADVEEELNLVAEDNNAVRIMNLHKSKGLEAPVVFLAHPCKKTSPRVERHIQRIGPIPQGYFLFTRENGYASEIIGQPPDWEQCMMEEINFLEAEETRLLYVAATRAKNLLVISRNPKDPELKKNPWAPFLKEVKDNQVVAMAEVSAAGPIEVLSEVDLPYQHPSEVSMTGQPPADWVSWGAELSSIGWLTGTPTGLKADSALDKVKRLEGGGKAWGTVVHRAFELLIKKAPNFAEELDLALSEQGLELERKAEMAQILEQFQQSKIWQNLHETGGVLTEVPFSVEIGPDSDIYPDVQNPAGLPVVLSGVIDLVYKGSEGWEIADYKTDRVVDAADMEILIEVYSKQVLLYCKIWKLITGQPVRRGKLYFTNWSGEQEITVYEAGVAHV